MWPPDEQPQPAHERSADRHEQRAHRERDVEVDVKGGVDRERERLGHPLEAPGEHDRRAELAQAAGERERLTRGQAAARERKDDAEEGARRPRTESARRGDHVRVDGLEGGDRRPDVERARNVGDGKRDRGLRERDREPQPL